MNQKVLWMVVRCFRPVPSHANNYRNASKALLNKIGEPAANYNFFHMGISTIFLSTIPFHRVLKVELETYKIRVKVLHEENRSLRHASVIIVSLLPDFSRFTVLCIEIHYIFFGRMYLRSKQKPNKRRNIFRTLC